MTLLDTLIPKPRLLEIDHVDVAAPVALAWLSVRHGDLGRSRIARALFAIRTLPSRLRGDGASGEHVTLRIDDIVSPDRPGFRLLGEDPGHEVAVGAIGPVWEPDIPFVDVRDPAAYAAFDQPGNAKVAWAIRVEPRGTLGSRIVVEVRVDATDEESWSRFRRYFALIGIGSRFIRKLLLSDLARELGPLEAAEQALALPGDDRLPDAVGQLTHSIDIRTTPANVWPWLVQMGARRGGFYSFDLLDNANRDSAREIHPELQSLSVGQVIAATDDGDDGFEVLDIQPERALVLGGLYDARQNVQLAFGAQRPERFWHVTWAFVLEPIDATTTRLRVRARAALSVDQWAHLLWARGVHPLMEASQLRGLAARAEGRLARDTWRDVADGLVGATAIVFDLLTPFLRPARSHWGLDEATANRVYPGDELVTQPRWGWTHGIEIAAPAERVWPWVAQIGADRGGFYSYQWLENLAGCDVHNAEIIHPEWAHRIGSGLALHPKMPSLEVVAMAPGRWLVALGAEDPEARKTGRPWARASWSFHVEPRGPERCRFISRFRVACSDDLATRLTHGPFVGEAIGFAMDRRMLLGVKERAERRA